MKWLVTGASGQLGRALSIQLSSSGLDFIALDSKQLDITNSDQVSEIIGAIKPQVIVNAAAWTDVDGAETKRDKVFEVNVKGVENLSLKAREIKSIFIHISSDYVFSGVSDRPWSEESLINPRGVYGQSKGAGE